MKLQQHQVQADNNSHFSERSGGEKQKNECEVRGPAEGEGCMSCKCLAFSMHNTFSSIRTLFNSNKKERCLIQSEAVGGKNGNMGGKPI